MIIDVHTHCFPDLLAKRALPVLVNNCKHMYTPVNDGTVSGLIKNMNNWNIDISVIQPVVTKPSQFKHLNDWAKEVCSKRIISFGGIHPETDDYKRDIDYIVNLGLKGIKLHPEYQNFIVDSSDMMRIYEYATDKGLILFFHAGYDPVATPPFKSDPKRFLNIINHFPQATIVAAHLGGHAQWNMVEEYLAGTDIYLDTSMGFDYYSKEQFLRILKKHTSEKILFGSDSPWSSAKSEIEHIKNLPIKKEDIDNILGLNAKRILSC